MNENYAVVIPARYGSTRLPGKPLLKIAGREMVLRTWDRTIQAVDQDKVYIATEDKRVADICEAEGAQVVMTSDRCLTGTDRLYEFSEIIGGLDFIINVQGDEPIINPADIMMVIERAKREPDVLWNGFAPITEEREWRSRTIPKVLVGAENKLLYMSRSPVPGNKNDIFDKAWKQICIYSFPVRALQVFGNHGKKTELEEIEDIEILRFLELGFDVRMIQLSGESFAVDTLDDLGEMERRLSRN